jgi:hypothetical protein
MVQGGVHEPSNQPTGQNTGCAIGALRAPRITFSRDPAGSLGVGRLSLRGPSWLGAVSGGGVSPQTLGSDAPQPARPAFPCAFVVVQAAGAGRSRALDRAPVTVRRVRHTLAAAACRFLGRAAISAGAFSALAFMSRK